MNILNPLKFAYIGLTTNKARSVLTMLGIIIGIAAVIVVMSAGEGIKGFVLNQLESFGSNYIEVEVKTPSTSHVSTENAFNMATGAAVTTLKLEDMEAAKKLRNISNAYAGTLGMELVNYADETRRLMIYGVSASYIDIDPSTVASGRFYSEEEDRELAPVVVLGSEAAKKIFEDENPIGKQIKIRKSKFTVIGVLDPKGGQSFMSFDDMIFMPVQTLQKKMLGVDYITFFLIQVEEQSRADETKDDLISLMRERHDISDPNRDDFAVMTMEEGRAMIDTVFGGITLLLIAIASISLLVGGIGIMNIMYVTVSERTYEIGLRKAIGATRSNILWQFMWEAICLTFLGGIIGIIIGIGLSYLVAVIAISQGFDWRFVVKPSSLALAAGFCIGVGLLFGLYPAQKAAKMNPIEALRNE